MLSGTGFAGVGFAVNSKDYWASAMSPLKTHFAGQRPAPESILAHAMRKIGSKRGWNCAMAIILWAGGFQLGLYAQQVAKLSPKVNALVNAPPVDIEDDD